MFYPHISNQDVILSVLETIARRTPVTECRKQGTVCRWTVRDGLIGIAFDVSVSFPCEADGRFSLKDCAVFILDIEDGVVYDSEWLEDSLPAAEDMLSGLQRALTASGVLPHRKDAPCAA